VSPHEVRACTGAFRQLQLNPPPLPSVSLLRLREPHRFRLTFKPFRSRARSTALQSNTSDYRALHPPGGYRIALLLIDAKAPARNWPRRVAWPRALSRQGRLPGTKILSRAKSSPTALRGAINAIELQRTRARRCYSSPLKQPLITCSLSHSTSRSQRIDAQSAHSRNSQFEPSLR